ADLVDVLPAAVVGHFARVPPPCAPVAAAREVQLAFAAAAERKHGHLALAVAPAGPHAQPVVNQRSALSAAAVGLVCVAPALPVADLASPAPAPLHLGSQGSQAVAE